MRASTYERHTSTVSGSPSSQSASEAQPQKLGRSRFGRHTPALGWQEALPQALRPSQSASSAHAKGLSEAGPELQENAPAS